MKIHSSVATVVATLIALTACSSGGSDPDAGRPAAAEVDLSAEATAACEQVFERSVPDAADRLVLVVDETASVADMEFPAELSDDLTRLSLADGSLSIIAVDGIDVAPRIVAKHVAVSTEGERDRPSVADLADVIPACVEAVYGDELTPTASGTDLHRALALAAELVGPGTTLWVLSDMLSNTGPLTLDETLIALEAEQAALAAAGRAPVGLAGVTLRVSGIANASTPLLPSHRTWLRDFTAGLCEAWTAQGCDSLKLDPENPKRTDTGLPEDVMPPFPDVTRTVTAAGCAFEVPASVAFAGDSADLGPDAVAALSQPLQLLLDNPGATAVVVGHTASSSAYTATELVHLSEQRAESVRGHFAAHGIPADRIEARGVGDTRPKVEDVDPATGRQIPSMAAIERRVDVLVEGVPCSR